MSSKFIYLFFYSFIVFCKIIIIYRTCLSTYLFLLCEQYFGQNKFHSLPFLNFSQNMLRHLFIHLFIYFHFKAPHLPILTTLLLN
nr:MAG TPA: hypothetical protein [Caudoviricetes sp.]